MSKEPTDEEILKAEYEVQSMQIAIIRFMAEEQRRTGISDTAAIVAMINTAFDYLLASEADHDDVKSWMVKAFDIRVSQVEDRAEGRTRALEKEEEEILN